MSKKVKEHIRQEIIEAARQIFSRYGFRKTTMEDIARATHKGKSSLYYYFPNKEEVFIAVIQHEASILRKELAEATANSKDAAEKMHKHVLVRMLTMQKLVNYYEAARHDHEIHFSFIENLREQFDQEEKNTIQEILNEGIQQGLFESMNTELAATTLVMALKGLEYPLIWEGKKNDLSARINKMMKILFYGLMKR